VLRAAQGERRQEQVQGAVGPFQEAPASSGVGTSSSLGKFWPGSSATVRTQTSVTMAMWWR